jgi:DNA (cytosine-5)-methyltransferase 1
MVKALKAIDLFCGCGGLTLGLKNAGFKVIAGIDSDKLAIETYKKNHSESKPYLESIKKLSPKKIMRDLKLKAGELDLLAGCPPCQGFSTLRTLNGRKDIVDARNDLIFDFLRFIRVMKPKAIMMENVPALYGDLRLIEFKEALKRLGYEYDYKVRDAQHFGVPQRRRRFVMLAVKGCKNVTLPPPSQDKVYVKSVLKGLTSPSKSKDNRQRKQMRQSCKILIGCRS